MSHFRVIPSIEELLQRDALRTASDRHGRESVTRAARHAADELRGLMAGADAAVPQAADQVFAWLEARTLALVSAHAQPSLRRVINATGVILHTNLGRAPLAASALTNARLAEGYSNLEYDLDKGERGHRHVHAERLLGALTGAEAALVANNTAAAALLTLAALAHGREVIVSRGELVEIGGGFRVPEVLAQSGAILREVGTTNRTRIGDYASAIGDRTALILRVHPSNFRMEGFTERPAVGDLANLVHRFGLPLVEDLGSGWLGNADDAGLASLVDEPSVHGSLDAGADLVMFSGDKLLGGPQAGIVLGRRDLIDRLRAHPLMRAVRVDKLTYAALEATLALWAEAPSRAHIPIYRMLTMTVDEIEQRALGLIQTLGGGDGRITCLVIDGRSTIGGGSAPGSTLPTRLIALSVDGYSASALETALRAGDPPIIARIQDKFVVIDVRTVAPDEIDALSKGIKRLIVKQ